MEKRSEIVRDRNHMFKIIIASASFAIASASSEREESITAEADEAAMHDDAAEQSTSASAIADVEATANDDAPPPASFDFDFLVAPLPFGEESIFPAPSALTRSVAGIDADLSAGDLIAPQAPADLIAGAAQFAAADEGVPADLVFAPPSRLTRSVGADADLVASVSAEMIPPPRPFMSREASYVAAAEARSAGLPPALARQVTESRESEVSELLSNPSAVADPAEAERRIAEILNISVEAFRASRETIEVEFMLARATGQTVEEMYRIHIMAERQIEEDRARAASAPLRRMLGHIPPVDHDAAADRFAEDALARGLHVEARELHRQLTVDNCPYCLDPLHTSATARRACGHRAHLRCFGNALSRGSACALCRNPDTSLENDEQMKARLTRKGEDPEDDGPSV